MTDIVACDPGWSGAFAHDSVITGASCYKMPDSIDGIAVRLKAFKAAGIGRLVVEQVGGFAGTGQPGSAMFRFGENFGAVIGVAVALGYRVERVHPQKWIKAHSLGTRGKLTKTQWKNKLKARAQELFPEVEVSLANADALLILDAARRGLI